jgi:F0F1-type ATP synthase delta subunit
MNAQEFYLARLYATAFFNTHGAAFSFSEYQALEEEGLFLIRHPYALFVFKLPALFDGVKISLLKSFFEEKKLSTLFQPLTDLLLKHQRLFLLPGIIKQLQVLYRERKHIEVFSIKTSHALTNEQRDLLKKILEHKTNSHILTHHRCDSRLIAGIRMQSDTLLWEYSIAKQLRTIERDLCYGN